MHHALRLSALALASLLLTGTALAEDRPQRPLGGEREIKSYTLNVVQQKTDTGFVRDTARTNDEGQSASGHVEFSADEAAGTFNRASSHTGFDGRSVSRNTAGERHEGGFTSDTTLQDGDGRTATAHTEGTGDPEAGAWTRVTTGTDFEGGSFRIEARGERTENGLSRRIVRSNAEGQTATEELTVQNNAQSRSRTVHLRGTNFDGSRYSRKVVSQGERQGRGGIFELVEGEEEGAKPEDHE